MLTSDEDQQLIDITDTPPLHELREELERCISDAAPYLDQYRYDFETRFCLWEGQSRDGKRWQSNLGSGVRARPWDGASDTRPFTADDIINEQVDLIMAAYWRANIQVTALRSTDLDWSQKVTVLLQWLLRNHLAEEMDREIELALNWRQGYGLAIIGVWWKQEWRLNQQVVKLEEMVQKALELAQQGNTGPMEALSDPLQDPKTIAAMMESSPLLDRQAAKKILRELREKGETVVPQVTALTNQPCIEALRPFLDVFFPVESPHLQGARWVQRRRQMSLADLETMVNTGQWDREWAKTVAETRGKSFGGLADYRDLPLRRAESTFAQNATGMLANENYVEIFDAYYHGLDRKTGVPVLMHTVWSPQVPDLYGRHEPFGYDHGEMPFKELVRERVERSMADSRSVAEIAGTFQGTIKTQRDAINDRAQMTTIPPLLVPMWRSGAEVKLGPAAQIAEKTGGELRWMQPPQATTDSAQAEMAAELGLARYFGRMHEQVHPQRTQLAQERLVGKSLREIAGVCRQMLKLCQQFMSETTIERTVGRLRMPFVLSREEIQGQFDLLLTLDAGNLNPELVKNRLAAFKDYVIAFDTEGVVNRAALAQMGAQMLDPYWAERIVGTPEQAAQSEAEDEKKNLASIMTGVEPPMRPEGQNYQLRLAVLQKEIADNPYLPARLDAQPDSAAMLTARLQHLQTMAEQYGINKQIGRTGAEPGLTKLREQMQKEQQPALAGVGQ